MLKALNLSQVCGPQNSSEYRNKTRNCISQQRNWKLEKGNTRWELCNITALLTLMFPQSWIQKLSIFYCKLHHYPNENYLWTQQPKKAEKEACIYSWSKIKRNLISQCPESTRDCYYSIYGEIPKELGKALGPMFVVECSQGWLGFSSKPKHLQRLVLFHRENLHRFVTFLTLNSFESWTFLYLLKRSVVNCSRLI